MRSIIGTLRETGRFGFSLRNEVVEAALFDVSDVVGHKVVAQRIALMTDIQSWPVFGCVARPTGLRMP